MNTNHNDTNPNPSASSRLEEKDWQWESPEEKERNDRLFSSSAADSLASLSRTPDKTGRRTRKNTEQTMKKTALKKEPASRADQSAHSAASSASNRTSARKAGKQAARTSAGKPVKKHHFMRRTLIGLLAFAAASFGAYKIYPLVAGPQIGSASLSSEQIDEMVRSRLMNQTSHNLQRIPVFAHRGFVEDNLDNTFASFDLALLSGCPQVELDVRTSSDGVLYVCHDDSLKGPAGLDWNITEHTSEELDQIILHNGEKLHRLSEVIGRYRDQLIYLIEFKDDRNDPQPFLDVVEAYPQYAYTMQVQSFYTGILEAIHEKLPNMFVQLLVNKYTEIDPALGCDWLDSLALDEKLISQKRIEQIHAAGKEVWLWTVDDPDAIHRYLSWGADGVITDTENAVLIYKEMAQSAQN